MKKLRESKAMRDDLIRCVSLIGCGLMMFSDNPNFEPWHKNLGTAAIAVLFAMCFLDIWTMWRDKRMTPEEKQEAKREMNDERSRMIQDRAMRNCWQVEGALLVIVTIIFIFRNQPAVYSVSYLVLVVRELACVTTRWWLNRKY